MIGFNQRLKEVLSTYKKLTNGSLSNIEKSQLLFEFRDLWIDITMVMQENDEVRDMSDRRFFKTLRRLLDTMCSVGKNIEGAAFCFSSCDVEISVINDQDNSHSNEYDLNALS